jgi:predicted transcriptional regulator
MDILYRLGSATASDVMKELPGNPSDSTVRTHLRILEEKGYVKHEDSGARYVYSPTVSRGAVRQSALKHLVDTFFEGSAGKAVAALLGKEGFRISDEELERISELIEKAKKEERGK